MDIHNSVEYENNFREKEMLKQFRGMLSDVINPDHTDNILLKWLRAKNFDLKKCDQIYRQNIRSNKMHKIETLEDIWDVPEVVQKYEFANDLGFAKDGTPIYFVAMGRGDLRGFVMSMDAFDIGKYCSFILVRLKKRCRLQSKKRSKNLKLNHTRLGKEIHEVTFIVDMEEFNLRHVLWTSIIELALDLIRMLQDHYPSLWKHIFVVNAPAYFYTFFNIIKPILRHSLLKNIHVVSKEETPNLLLKYVDSEVLPAFLGGTLVDSQGNPMCSEFMKFGAPIPEEYYLRNRSPLLPTEVGANEVWISQRSCHNHSLVIREADSIIRLEVRTEGGSIVVNVLFREFGSDPENIDLPSKDEYLDENNEKCNVVSGGNNMHHQCHLSPTNNYIFAPWPGIYIFRFDNSYNWLTSRKLIYRIRVLPPGV